MQLKTCLNAGFNAGIFAIAAVALAAPVSAQPIPAIASNACIQRTAEEMVVAAREIQVTGGGRVDASTGVQTLFMRNTVTGQTAECRVNTIDGFVLDVRLTSQPNRPPQAGGVPQASIDACIQQTAEAMVVAAREIQMVEAGPANGLGERTLFMRNTVTGQTAECRVNTSTNRVLSVQLTSQPNRPTPPPAGGRPVSPTDPTVRSCQAAIANRIRRDFAGVQQLNFLTDTTRKNFVSNAISAINGEGQFYQRNTSWFRFSYNCQVNVRNGQVTSSNYRVLR